MKVLFQVGDVHLVKIHGAERTKDHIAVITAIEQDRVQVIYGQTHPGRAKSVAVEAESREGKLLHLEWITHFRITNVLFVKPVHVKQKRCRCPQDLFIDLKALAVEATVLNLVSSQLGT